MLEFVKLSNIRLHCYLFILESWEKLLPFLVQMYKMDFRTRIILFEFLIFDMEMPFCSFNSKEMTTLTANGSSWQPQEQGIKEICGLLEQQISPVSTSDKTQIWQQLQHYSQFPDFNNYLSFILSHAEVYFIIVNFCSFNWLLLIDISDRFHACLFSSIELIMVWAIWCSLADFICCYLWMTTEVCWVIIDQDVAFAWCIRWSWY